MAGAGIANHFIPLWAVVSAQYGISVRRRDRWFHFSDACGLVVGQYPDHHFPGNLFWLPR